MRGLSLAPVRMGSVGFGSSVLCQGVPGSALHMGRQSGSTRWAAVPAHVWHALPKTRKDTGYTHQWRLPMASDFARLTMASVHSLEERTQAKAQGFRTFRIIGDVRDLGKGEILCPASKEAGARTTCAACGLCDGSTGENDKRKDIAIVAH